VACSAVRWARCWLCLCFLFALSAPCAVCYSISSPSRQGLLLCSASYGGRHDAFTLASLFFTGPLTPLGVVGPSVGNDDTVECSDIPCILIAPFSAATLSPCQSRQGLRLCLASYGGRHDAHLFISSCTGHLLSLGIGALCWE